MHLADEIREKLLALAVPGEVFRKQDLLAFFPDHASLVAYVLKDAVQRGVLEKKGVTRGARYMGTGVTFDDHGGGEISRSYARGEQSEEDIFAELQDVFLRRYPLSENARHIVAYSFTEMVNNAIDHSASETIDVTMRVSDGVLRFTVRDRGVGVFRNVMRKRNLSSERAALVELTKGKVTTAPMWHSGEGIFFTSRAADAFRLSSGLLTMERRSADDGGVEIIENDDYLEGTLVEFRIAIDTPRHLARDVFRQFDIEPEEHDFGRTEIEVRLFQRGNVHVSRSQAKRIMEGLEQFKVVVLDFSGVPFIGQGFADQIFRVFVREHPETRIIVRNTVPDVQYMIDRARKE